jgi:hypothetical protein
MKKIMKRGFDVSTLYHCRSDKRTYSLALWEQPLRRWLVAKAYHWYDMRIYKVPGFKLLERFLIWLHRNDPMIYLPLSAEQDCRCYFLGEKEKVVLALIEVNKELRDQLHPQSAMLD